MPSIARIRKAKGNQICADCPTEHPNWVSFLKDYKDKNKSQISVEGYLAVLVCDKCARQHKSLLGTMVKSLEDSGDWTVQELQVVLQSGNVYVNGFYEAVNFSFDKNILISADDQDKQREKFIKIKYKHCKYRNDIALELALGKLIGTSTVAVSGKESSRSAPSKACDNSRDDGKVKEGKVVESFKRKDHHQKSEGTNEKQKVIDKQKNSSKGGRKESSSKESRTEVVEKRETTTMKKEIRDSSTKSSPKEMRDSSTKSSSKGKKIEMEGSQGDTTSSRQQQHDKQDRTTRKTEIRDSSTGSEGGKKMEMEGSQNDKSGSRQKPQDKHDRHKSPSRATSKHKSNEISESSNKGNKPHHSSSSKTHGNRDDKTVGESNSKSHSKSSGKSSKGDKTSEPDSSSSGASSGIYSNLASLVQQKKAPPTSTKTDRTLPSEMDATKMYKLANVVVKAHDDGLNTLDASTRSASGTHTHDFRGLSKQVDEMRRSSTQPYVNPSKMEKLTKAMARVSNEMTDVGDEWKEQDEYIHTTDIEGLMAAKKFGEDAAKEYDQEALMMHQRGHDILRNSGK